MRRLIFLYKSFILIKEFVMGKIIGKQGKNARAIRTVMKSVAAKERKKVDIEFAE